MVIAPPQGGTPNLPVQGQPAPLDPKEFQSGSVANLTKFGFDDVAPPSPLYIQRDDKLSLSAWSLLGGTENVIFVLRFLRVPEAQGGQPSDGGVGRSPGAVFTRGIVQTDIETISFTGSGGINRIVNLAEGYLLSLGAIASLATGRGQTFARASLVRGAAVPQPTAQPLFADYVTTVGPTGWPGGRILYPTESTGNRHSVQVGNPGAGADWSAITPATTRRQVISLNAQLLTSAAVANRNVELIVDDGANVVWRTSAPASVAANTTQQIAASGNSNPTGVVTTDFNLLIPPGLVLEPSWRLRVATANIQAADQWSAIWLNVEDWLEGI